MTETATSQAQTSSSRLATRALELGVVILFVALAWNNVALRRELAQARAGAPARGAVASFAPGDALTVVQAVDLAGRPITLDFRTSRTLVAIVNPDCASCETTVGSLKGATGARVLSVASAEETRPLMERGGIAHFAYSLPAGTPGELGRKLHHYPQTFIVDRGIVVRTCRSVEECS
ncbi:MAG TPA: hypothetical protein VE974_04540 [Thermoanaerobaculia bacterium]|nr:hypothetical protein [Thermoanaerobaculia bacterium]